VKRPESIEPCLKGGVRKKLMRLDIAETEMKTSSRILRRMAKRNEISYAFIGSTLYVDTSAAKPIVDGIHQHLWDGQKTWLKKIVNYLSTEQAKRKQQSVQVEAVSEPPPAEEVKGTSDVSTTPNVPPATLPEECLPST
jgi:hypothetical protein